MHRTIPPFVSRSFAVLGLVALAACAEQPVAPAGAPEPGGPAVLSSSASASKRYVLMGGEGALPADLATRVAELGGALESSLDALGVAVVTSDAPEFAALAGTIDGVDVVAEDIVLTYEMPFFGAQVEADAAVDVQSHQVGGHETFRRIQWAPDAISAPAAWALGHQGAGARVAILDGGIHSPHIDIAPNLDAARSVSFVPGQAYNADGGTFWHGTHVAGIVAAPANNIGTVGIAPQATVIGVKVLHNGTGAFSWVINGIYYAATPVAQGGGGAHIINMSLGAAVLRNENNALLLEALNRATNYAYKNGVTVIAAAGNSAIDLLHSDEVIFIPAMSINTIAVAATGPMGFALGEQNFDRPASYTNYGKRAIDFAGPGGDSALPGNALCSIPRMDAGVVTNACWVFDMVMAPCRGGAASISSYCWASGTSMAAPAVAGVAALIVGKEGPMHPAQLEARLRKAVDNPGKRGNDDYYGKGRINALKAVQ